MNTAHDILTELRGQLDSIYWLACEHMNEAEDAVIASRDHRALNFLDRCAAIINDWRPPLHERLRLLTVLLEPLECPGAHVAPDSEIIIH
jgi:hypothetical protein